MKTILILCPSCAHTCARGCTKTERTHLFTLLLFECRLPPSSPLLFSLSLSALVPAASCRVTGGEATPGDPWPWAGHLGRYVGRWQRLWKTGFKETTDTQFTEKQTLQEQNKT